MAGAARIEIGNEDTSLVDSKVWARTQERRAQNSWPSDTVLKRLQLGARAPRGAKMRVHLTPDARGDHPSEGFVLSRITVNGRAGDTFDLPVWKRYLR